MFPPVKRFDNFLSPDRRDAQKVDMSSDFRFFVLHAREEVDKIFGDTICGRPVHDHHSSFSPI